jgi:hypothetical protein
LFDEPEERSQAHFSSYMAVTKDWKYIYSAPDDKELFYGKNNDHNEAMNLVSIPETLTAVYLLSW